MTPDRPTPLTDALSTDPAIERRDVPSRVWREMAQLERQNAELREALEVIPPDRQGDRVVRESYFGMSQRIAQLALEAGRSSMREEAAKVRGAAMAMLEAIEHEAVASLAASVAVDNFSDPTPDVDAAEKAMLVASEKTRELEEALGCYFHKGKWHEGIRPGGRHDQNRRVR